MADDIPQWAIERACELSNAIDGRDPGSDFAMKPKDIHAYVTLQALARYIAAHEEPPLKIDPLMTALADLGTGFNTLPIDESAELLRQSLAKRGYEIREAQP